MTRKKILTVTIVVLAACGEYYLSTDKNNFTGVDIKGNPVGRTSLFPDERMILYLASLAPSGNYAQSSFVKPLNHFVGSLETMKVAGSRKLIRPKGKPSCRPELFCNTLNTQQITKVTIASSIC